MSVIAITPVMNLTTGGERFESRRRKKSNSQSIICGSILRSYFKLPDKVTELWLTAHDTPVAGSLHVTLKRVALKRGALKQKALKRVAFDWVSCTIKGVDIQNIQILEKQMDRWLVKRFRLKKGDEKTIYVTCEYR